MFTAGTSDQDNIPQINHNADDSLGLMCSVSVIPDCSEGTLIHQPQLVSSLKCVACDIGDLPSDAHKCTLCHQNVHIIPGCSVTAGEGYGDKRVCSECHNDKNKSATLPLQACENWKGLGTYTTNRSRGRYLGAQKRIIKDMLNFENPKKIPILKNGSVMGLQFVKLKKNKNNLG